MATKNYIYSKDCDNCLEPFWDKDSNDLCQKCSNIENK